jgi:hypothetical protein
VAPITGRIVRVGRAYRDSDLGSVHLQGIDKFDTAWVKLLYVRSDMPGGAVVRQGRQIGTVQDVAGYWAAKHPERGGPMKNHVHLVLRIYIDPGRFLGALPDPVFPP